MRTIMALSVIIVTGKTPVFQRMVPNHLHEMALLDIYKIW